MVKARNGRIAVIRPEDEICQLRLVHDWDLEAISQFGVAYRSRLTDFVRGTTAAAAGSATAFAEQSTASFPSDARISSTTARKTDPFDLSGWASDSEDEDDEPIATMVPGPSLCRPEGDCATGD